MNLFNPLAWLAIADKLIGYLRDPNSNLRWALQPFIRLCNIILQALSTNLKPIKIPKKSRASNFAFTAFTMTFFMLSLILTLWSTYDYLRLVNPVMHKSFWLFLLLLAIIGVSGCYIGWLLTHIKRNYNALSRYWPQLTTIQRLQASLMFFGANALVFAIY